MSLPTFASLFSGFGLVELALRGLVQPVAAVECDPQIAEVYARNHGRHITCARVQDVSYRAWAGIDWIHASPVCTNASQASQSGESEDDYLMALAGCRAIDHARPKVFTLENVQGYAKFKSFEAILTTLRRWYRVQYSVWDAADFGTPQNRKRLLLVATRKDWHDGPVIAPVKTHSRKATLFTPAWNGWHEACLPYLGECEPSQLAPWQLARLGGWDGVRTILCGGANTNLAEAAGGRGVPDASSPGFTVTANKNGGGGTMRAVLVHPNADCDRFPRPKDTDPAFTVATFQGGVPKAVLIDGKTDSYGGGVRAVGGGGGPPRP